MTDTKQAASEAGSLVTIERTIAVLEMITNETDGLSLSEISRRLGVNKSIAKRILVSLEDCRYLFRAAETDHYLPSLRIANLGLRVSYANVLMAQVQPLLNDLADRTGELVLFSIASESGPHWVGSAMGSARRRLRIEPSMRMELHTTASGKAWLATQPDERVRALLGTTLPATTDRSVTDVEVLLRQLAEIRRDGVAHTIEESEVGIRAMAVRVDVPHLSHPDQLTTAGFLSITAPVSRADASVVARSIDLLEQAAQQIAAFWPLSAEDGRPKLFPDI